MDEDEGLGRLRRPRPCSSHFHFGGTRLPPHPAGDPKGPPNPTSSALAPTDRSASCLTSRLRLMPIGCPWWASGPRPSNMCRGTSPSPDSPVRKSPPIENVSGLLPRCWPHLEHLSYSFPRTPHTILPPSYPISAYQAASTHSLSQYKHHHH